MLRLNALLVTGLCSLSLFAFADGTATTTEQEKYAAWANQLWQSLHRQHGKIELPNGMATLSIGEKFYYLNPDDADKA
ncbi:MAG: hypothetical protein HY080_08560 [Gammaproteobacteria bacterium]|nr:hypothetical protein [Gammaproteobacteria bacterium]